MAFDDTNWRSPDPPADDPPQPKVSRQDELVLLVLIGALAFALLLLPISLPAFDDLVRWVQRR